MNGSIHVGIRKRDKKLVVVTAVVETNAVFQRAAGRST